MALLTPLFLQAATGDTALSYTASDYRMMISTLAPVQGVVLENDLKVSQRAAGANMSVDVAAGRAIVAGTSVANQGSYIVQNTAVVNVTIAAAHATLPRIDLIVAKVNDKPSDGGTTYNWTPLRVAGTAAASPVAPAVPANSLVLAHVAVAAAAASIVTANITNKRVLSGVGDAPKWDFYGGHGQSIPSAVETFYAPSGTFQQVGMSTTGMNTGEVQCLTPGRYTVHFGVRLDAPGPSCLRGVIILLRNSAGTVTQRRILNASVLASSGVSVAGTIYMTTGERMSALIYQDSGGALAINDAAAEANFTGVWVGP